MSIKKQIWDATSDAADSAVGAIVEEARQRRERAAEERDRHLDMLETLPRWRRLARAWHRMMARRMAARANAQEKQGKRCP